VRGTWIDQFHPLSDTIAERLDAGAVPALAQRLDACARLREGNLVVLDAGCVAANGSRR
jgi:hypothetical protein